MGKYILLLLIIAIRGECQHITPETLSKHAHEYVHDRVDYTEQII